MAFEIFLPDPESDWNEGVLLEEYKGVFSLISAGKSQNSDGVVYKKWVFPQKKDKTPTDKAIPMKVRLGSKRQAVKSLQYFLEQLTDIQAEDHIRPF